MYLCIFMYSEGGIFFFLGVYASTIWWWFLCRGCLSNFLLTLSRARGSRREPVFLLLNVNYSSSFEKTMRA